MVDILEDRFQKKGQVISGSEKIEWTNLKNQLNLIDVGVVGEYTWQNYGIDSTLRKARLDRCYTARRSVKHSAGLNVKPIIPHSSRITILS